MSRLAFRVRRAAVLMLLAGAVALSACGPSYDETRKVDTIEAWEEFLTQTNSSSPHYYKAENRLAELELEATRAEGTPEAFDAFLEKFSAPQFKPLREKADALREDVIYNWADEQGTVEAWEKFLAEFPKTKRRRNRGSQSRTAGWSNFCARRSSGWPRPPQRGPGGLFMWILMWWPCPPRSRWRGPNTGSRNGWSRRWSSCG